MTIKDKAQANDFFAMIHLAQDVDVGTYMDNDTHPHQLSPRVNS